MRSENGVNICFGKKIINLDVNIKIYLEKNLRMSLKKWTTFKLVYEIKQENLFLFSKNHYGIFLLI